MALLPGDVIATGTPDGVGIGFKPPKFLKDRDVIEISISRIGTLRNEVRRVG
jgi:2-keto-4-pentenoate hydratase/2-oxohepta-3-ene-1,7-dioic acid hydratase in catechol pathway